MTLAHGSRLGAYDVKALLGAGGMGEVYQARDTKLNRDVALKILPREFALDPERLARFKREAQVLALLNHPNIAAIYGFEDADTTHALVLELVDGLTLAERIERGGALPLPEATAVARQIAEALEGAHEQGVIHRDLKPANIKLRPDGTVKVLDFGLAKAMEPAMAASGSATLSPTITSPAMTQLGVILGTAAYMSPEQAKGRPADKRSDVWAFGCVLYEMLTGTRAFDGEDVSETLASVLKAEPDWNRIAGTPAPLRTLVRRCLDKDRRKRIGDLSTVRFVLDEADAFQAGGTAAPAASPPRMGRQIALFVVAAVVASVATAAVMWVSTRAVPAPAPVVRFPIALAESQGFGSHGLGLMAISPDATQLVYAAGEGTGNAAFPNSSFTVQRLYRRSLSDDATKPIPGAESQAALGSPVSSPDGRSLVFYTLSAAGPFNVSRGLLKRIGLDGGTAATLCEIGLPWGISWTREGLVVGQTSTGVLRVPVSGGEPETIVRIKEGEIAEGPQLLPGGDAVLFTHLTAISEPAGPSDEAWDRAQIVAQSLKTGERKILLQGGSDARYLPTGHLVYAVAGVMRAVPFDVRRLAVTGPPTPVLEGVRRARYGPITRTGLAHFAVSEAGAVMYLAGPVSPASALMDLALLDRKGNVEYLHLTPGKYEFPRVSPDGTKIAVALDDDRGMNVWIVDLSRASPQRQLTFGGKNRYPIWSADGQHVAFQSDREGDLAVYWQRADGSQPAERLTRAEPGTAHVPDSWLPKGDRFLFDVESALQSSLWTFSLADRKSAAFGGVKSPTMPPSGVFSPDGRWVAYQSDEARQPRVFVQPFPSTGATYPVATGRHPRWSTDGKQLLYAVTNRIFAVTVNPGSVFTFGNPIPMTQGFSLAPGRTSHDLMKDGEHVVGVTEAQGQVRSATTAARRIEVVLNWFEELKQRAPSRD